MSKSVTSFTSQIVEFSTDVPFDTVIARLDAEINKKGSRNFLASLAKVTDQKSLVSLVERKAKHGFLYFNHYPHHWHLSCATGRPVPRKLTYVLGNPTIAQKIILLNPAAAYGVPPRVLLQEKEGRDGTDVLYHLPSSVLGLTAPGEENPQLTEILEDLDSKLERLAKLITAPVPEAQAHL